MTEKISISLKKYTLEIGRMMEAHRLVMSWIREGGDLKNGADENFTKWVDTLKLPERDKKLVMFMANNGKMEFEESARKFLAD